MSTLQEIQLAVQCLSTSDLIHFRDWFAQFDAKTWDRKFKDDVHSGRLDHLADEALSEQHVGLTIEL